MLFKQEGKGCYAKKLSFKYIGCAFGAAVKQRKLSFRFFLQGNRDYFQDPKKGRNAKQIKRLSRCWFLFSVCLQSALSMPRH